MSKKEMTLDNFQDAVALVVDDGRELIANLTEIARTVGENKFRERGNTEFTLSYMLVTTALWELGRGDLIPEFERCVNQGWGTLAMLAEIFPEEETVQ